MVTKKKEDELFEKYIIEVLKPIFSKYKFKYVKSRKQFEKKYGDIDHIVSIYRAIKPLKYNEEEENLTFDFQVYGSIRNQGFNTWFKEKAHSFPHSIYTIPKLLAQSWIDTSDLKPEEIIGPTPKHVLKEVLFGDMKNKETPIDILDLLEHGISDMVKDFDEKSDHPTKIDGLKSDSLKEHPFYLFYMGCTVEAEQAANNVYQNLMHEAESQSTIESKSYAILQLDQFITLSKELMNFNFVRPAHIFKSTVPTLLPSNNREIKFNEYIYSELFSIDCRQFEKNKTSFITPTGDMFIYFNKNRIIKFNPEGGIELDFEIEMPKGIRTGLHNAPHGYIESKELFYYNHCLIDKNLNITYLKLPPEDYSAKGGADIKFGSANYLAHKEEFHVVLKKHELVFSLDGELKSQISITTQNIMRNRNGVTSSEKLYDFDGKVVLQFDDKKLKKHFLSDSGNYLVTNTFASISHCLNNRTKKKKVIWIHPTRIKGYKEQFNSTNLYLGSVHFSPKEDFMVAGSAIGNAVAWTLPDLKRVELIPPAHVLDQMNKLIITKKINGTWTEIEIAPEVFELKGQNHLRNDNNYLSNVYFIENGKFFITVFNKNLLIIWNNKFEFISAQKTEGFFTKHNENYIDVSSENKVEIYRRKKSRL